MARVLVAVGSSIQRHLIGLLLETDPAFEVIGHADDGAEAVQLAERLQPDMIAMDLHMPVLDAVEATRQIMDRAPTRVVILSSEDELDLGRGAEALRAGAVIVVPKPGTTGSPEYEARRTMFLEMMRAALHRTVRPRADDASALQLDPLYFATPSLDFKASSIPSRIRLRPFTRKDRAARLRELLDADAWDEDGPSA
jgi:two-component system chemotaxis response regulator CheB